MKIICQKCNTKIYDLTQIVIDETEYITSYRCEKCGHKNLHDGEKYLNNSLEFLFSNAEIEGVLKKNISLEYLKYLRKSEKLTQVELAEKADVSLAAVKGLEAGYNQSVFQKCLNVLLLKELW